MASPKILFTSTTWWPLASRLAIALSGTGCDVAAVCPASGHPLRKTSVVQRRFVYSPLDPVNSLAAAIVEYRPDIIIPCDDRAVQHLHELHALGTRNTEIDVPGLIERSLGSPDSYPVVSRRDRLLDIAREEGLRVPETRCIRSANDLEAWCARHAGPLVLKRDGSWGGHGVTIAHHPKDAARDFLALKKPLSAARAVKRLIVDRDAYWLRTWWRRDEVNVSTQSYVPGRPANCAFFCWEGRVLAGISVEVLQAQGNTGAATVVRPIENWEMDLAAERIARRLHLSGLIGLDFMIEEGSGATYLIEMNPRCTPLCHLQLGTGHDLVEAVRAQLAGQPVRETPAVTKRNTIAYFPQALHWDRESEFVRSSFHDVPWQEPELVQELLKLQWPDRGLLARILSRLRHTSLQDQASRGGNFEGPAARRNLLVLPKRTVPFDDSKASDPFQPKSVVPLRQEGQRNPVFLLPGVDGHVGRFQTLVRHLEADQPVFGLQSQALLRERTALTRVEEMAAYHLKEVRALQPYGPYCLLGFSFGGLVAFEMARQLRAAGEQVGLVGMIDNCQMGSSSPPDNSQPEEIRRQPRGPSLASHLTHLFSARGLLYAREKLSARGLRAIYTALDTLRKPIPRFLQFAYDINWFAAVRYVPQRFPGKITLFQAAETVQSGKSTSDWWARFAEGGVELHEIAGGHENLFTEPQVKLLAKAVTESLSRADAPAVVLLARG